MTNLGTFISSTNRPRPAEPVQSLALVLLEGASLVIFVLGGLAWLAA